MRTIVMLVLLLAGVLWAEPVMKMTPAAANEQWKKLTIGANVALHSKVVFSSQPTFNLTIAGGTDANDLTDGVLAGADYEDRLWYDPKAVGWYESGASGGFNILMDLGKVQPIDRAVLRALGGRFGWCFVTPQRFEVYISKDGKAFYPVAALDKLKPGESVQSDWVKNYYVEESGTAFAYPFEFKIRSEARYIGFTIYGEADAVFLDEIAVMSPPTVLSAAQIAAPYQGKGAVFYISGLDVAPRIGKLVISSNVYTPNHLVVHDMRGGKGLADPLHLTVEVPENIDIVFPAVESREKMKVNGRACQRLTFTVRKSRFKIPYTDEIFFSVKGDLAADAAVTLYDADNTVDPIRQTFPIEVISIPEVSPQPKHLQISLAWMDDMEAVNWPHFTADWKKLGFNAVGTFPHYYQTERLAGEPEKIRRFLTDARTQGYKIIMLDWPLRGVGREPGNEVFSILDSNDSKHICPTYRGQYYQQELDRIKNAVLASRPDYVIWDIECWQEGGDDGLTGRCLRCKKAIAASGKTPEEFMKETGVELFGDSYNAVQSASSDANIPMPLVASYNHHASIPVHQVVTDFNRIYPKYVKQAQPSLYVGGRAEIVHKAIRANYKKMGTRDILAWLSTGTYGELEPRKVEPMIFEALLNGAIGFTYNWSADFDTPLEFYYHARAMAKIAPYEDLLISGDVLEPTGSNTALYYSGIGRKDEMLLLVGNYDMASETTIAEVSAELSQAVDLISGEKTKIAKGKLNLTVPKDGYRIVYCSK